MKTENIKNSMTYKEFRDGPLSKEYYTYRILTVSREIDIDEPAAVRAIIAQFEPSNAKWYVPSAYEGRTVCGYTNEIWFGREHGNWYIEDIRPIYPR